MFPRARRAGLDLPLSGCLGTWVDLRSSHHSVREGKKLLHLSNSAMFRNLRETPDGESGSNFTVCVSVLVRQIYPNKQTCTQIRRYGECQYLKCGLDLPDWRAPYKNQLPHFEIALEVNGPTSLSPRCRI